ncbi:MAG TPA: dTDP-4-amino-4,6-dideoxygalactose transaminase [Gemmatimonadaceae bacterium]|nr:dTDP-4-amino-4,6-dideoxygalactose transaminase [Gemmatimonadaceae bacterium]
MTSRDVVVPFNRPYVSATDLPSIAEALESASLSGDGKFTGMCNRWLEANTGCSRALLTNSCTAALEMAALLIDIQPGDEVILPSFTFVTSASAFVLRGAVPVFVDIRTDTLNIDETLIEAAITPRTKAIVAVHYAGVACDMDAIMAIAERHSIFVIEDAAQGLMSTYKGRPLGSIGHLGCVSFHDTKNIISGEGGALLINAERFVRRAEVLRDKGTNRTQFLRGEVDKYTWVDLGSSFLPGEITAALLWSQLGNAQEITDRRIQLWERYHSAFAAADAAGLVHRPAVAASCVHNAHMYYLIIPVEGRRAKFIEHLRSAGVQAVFHYVPLHSSPYGARVGRVSGPMTNTDALSECLVRLPMWVGLEPLQDVVISVVYEALELMAAEGIKVLSSSHQGKPAGSQAY